jgi:hypothetical protein
MSCVQINADGAGGQGYTRAFALAFTTLGIYCRLQITTTSATWQVQVAMTNASAQSGIYYNPTSLRYFNNVTDAIIINGPAINTWYDAVAVRLGANVQTYWKLATDSVWTAGGSVAAPSFTPNQLNLGHIQGVETSANQPVRMGKVVIWSAAPTPTVAQAEANSRDLQDQSGNVWYFNRWDDEKTAHIDYGGQGNIMTILGTPAFNANDPGFLQTGPVFAGTL